VVLASATSYFYAMFTQFSEKNQDSVVIKHLKFTDLKHLIDYIYSGEILVSETNVKVGNTQCLI